VLPQARSSDPRLDESGTHGTFTVDGPRLRLPTAAGCALLWLRLDRSVPYPVDPVRSVTLLHEGGRLWVEVTAELPVAAYPPGGGPVPERVAGVDLGIIHPYAVAGPDGHGLLVSGRVVRAEHRLHLADTKARRRATAGRVPARGQRGVAAVAKTRARARVVEGRHTLVTTALDRCADPHRAARTHSRNPVVTRRSYVTAVQLR
jgi:putative transposase